MKRTGHEARIEKRQALKKAEEQGIIADSIEVRVSIVNRVKAGEITLEQGQAELRKIKREAKKNGKVTRNQVYRES